MIRQGISIVILFTIISYQSYAQEGFQKIKSKHSVEGTVSKLKNVLTQKGMNIFSTINHQQGATKSGLELRPTTLVIFGNPKVGTKLMQCDQRMGLALPLKMLIWEDEAGETWLGYWLPTTFKDQYNLDSCNEVITKVTNAMANFAKAATS